MFEYEVILEDGTTSVIIAKNMTDAIKNFDEEESGILSIFRNASVVISESDPAYI